MYYVESALLLMLSSMLGKYSVCQWKPFRKCRS